MGGPVGGGLVNIVVEVGDGPVNIVAVAVVDVAGGPVNIVAVAVVDVAGGPVNIVAEVLVAPGWCICGCG